MAKRALPAATLPEQVRLFVPVLGPAGGSGRSTAAGLLACSLASMGSTVVLDTVPRLSSPWPSWPSEEGAGLVAVPPDQPVTRRQIQAAASRCAAREGRSWQVMTDHQSWSSPPLPLPTDPAAWYQLAAAGGWQAVVADTAYPVAPDLLAARAEGRTALTTAWCSLPYAVPVLCAAATGPGVQALQAAVKVAAAEQLPLTRTVVVFMAIGEGRLPAAVRAAATMLQPQVAAVVQVPYEPQIRAHGLSEAGRLKSRFLEASSELAHAVLDSARTAWGDPLPAAPVPAAASPPRQPPSARPARSPEGVPA